MSFPETTEQDWLKNSFTETTEQDWLKNSLLSGNKNIPMKLSSIPVKSFGMSRSRLNMAEHSKSGAIDTRKESSNDFNSSFNSHASLVKFPSVNKPSVEQLFKQPHIDRQNTFGISRPGFSSSRHQPLVSGRGSTFGLSRSNFSSSRNQPMEVDFSNSRNQPGEIRFSSSRDHRMDGDSQLSLSGFNSSIKSNRMVGTNPVNQSLFASSFNKNNFGVGGTLTQMDSSQCSNRRMSFCPQPMSYANSSNGSVCYSNGIRHSVQISKKHPVNLNSSMGSVNGSFRIATDASANDIVQNSMPSLSAFGQVQPNWLGVEADQKRLQDRRH